MSDISFSLETYQTILYNVFHLYNQLHTNTEQDSINNRASVYAIQKLDSIMKELPDTIKTYYDSFEKREEQRMIIEENQREYINTFLKNSNGQLFYIPKTDVYIKYNGDTCEIVNENSIWHNVLTELSDSSHPLFSRRYMVKISLMHKLKQQNILGMTPSSHTIQRILGFLTPTFLDTKESAKHFLIVLGDMILRKNEMVYLVNNTAKAFLEAIEQYIYFYWAGSIRVDGFKYKYYDHTYEQCRLIRFHKSIEQQEVWGTFLKNFIMDIVMVATHYSTRYTSADAFIESCYDEELKEYVLYLKKHTKQDLVERFIGEYLEKSDTDISIRWNQMIYLWKMFVEEEGIPSVIMMKQLKELLIKNGIPYGEEKFYGVSSKYLQTVQDFETFWNEMIVYDSQESLETGELLIAYNQWAKKTRQSGKSISKLSESKISMFVSHFHDIPVVDRVVSGISCFMWKRGELIETYMKDNIHSTPKHWTDVYEEMSSQWNTMTDIPPVSMTYFRNWLTHRQYQEWIE